MKVENKGSPMEISCTLIMNSSRAHCNVKGDAVLTINTKQVYVVGNIYDLNVK